MVTYSVKDVARLTGKHPETIRRWIRGGYLKAIKGQNGSQQSHYIISQDEIDRILGRSKEK